MSKARVPLFGQPRNFVNITPEATVGATIGVNLYNADGTLFDPSTLTGSSTTIVNGVGYAHDKRTGNAITINADDDKKIIELTFAGAITITVSGLIPFSRGFDFIVFCSGSGGQATFAGTNGMVISSPDSLKTRTLYSPVGLMVDDTNEATLYGDIEPVAPSLSVLARALNSIGAPAFLVAAANGQVLRRFGDVLAFSNVLASEVTNTPAGNIASTTVQTAINELDTEKAPVVHTHTASQITDFNSASRAQTEAELVAGANVTITPSGSGATRQLTIATTGGGGVTVGDKGDITVTGSPYVAGDLDFDSVTALLHFDGVDGSTTFTDVTGKVFTASGNAQIDTAQSKWGGASGLFDGAGDIVSSTNTGIITLSGDFTVEYWVRQVTAGVSLQCHTHLYDSGGTNNGLNIYRRTSDGALMVDNGITGTTAGTIVISLSTWTHIAVVRDSGTIRGYVNGVQALSHAAQSYPATINLSSIGMFKGGLYPFDGHIDDWRVTNGVCRYLSGTTFSPPAQAFYDSLPSAIDGDPEFASVSSLLHFDGADASTTFTDVTGKVWTVAGNAQIDTAQSKFGGASGLFDGSGDYVTSPSSADFTFGAGDFTVEGWVRFNANTDASLIDNRFGSYGTDFVIYDSVVGATIQLSFFANGANRATTASLSTGVWYHIAVCRASGTTRCFLDGTQFGTNYTDANNYNQTQFRYGANYLNSAVLNGWLDDWRITKGVARYTTTFSPPSRAYYDALPVGVAGDPDFASVVSLLHFDGTDGSTTFTDVAGNAWTAVGNAQIDTAQSKFGGASGLMDGTGDYISTPDNAIFYLGSADFTIEGWARTNGAVGATACFVGQWATSNLQFTVGVASTNRAYFSLSTNGTSGTELIGANNSVPTSEWFHFAAVRDGSTHYYYINGVSVVSGAISGALFDSAAEVRIGSNGIPQAFNGWLDDIRITTGVCRYRGGFAFTPPTIPYYDSLPSGDEPLWTVDEGAITFPKMQDINTNKLLGRSTAGIGDIQEITLGTNLSMAGGTLNGVVDDLNKVANLTFWTGTQAQYDALGAWGASTLYFIEP